MLKTRFEFIPNLIVLTAVLMPCRAQEQPYYFIQLSDPQIGMYSENKSFEQETANLEFAVATINRLKPGFVIVTGDLVNKTGDPAQISEYLRICGKIDPSVRIFQIAGNHDVGNEPTPESLTAYREKLGRDYYSFRAGPVYGIVLNSALIYSPNKVLAEYQKQEAWLKSELEEAKTSGAKHILVFQHHPYFLANALEPDQYANIPLERRGKYLDLLKNYSVRYVFAGHHHQNVISRDGDLEIIASGPVGKPLGEGRTGMRVVMLKGTAIEHRYYDFSALPERLSALWK